MSGAEQQNDDDEEKDAAAAASQAVEVEVDTSSSVCTRWQDRAMIFIRIGAIPPIQEGGSRGFRLVDEFATFFKAQARLQLKMEIYDSEQLAWQVADQQRGKEQGGDQKSSKAKRAISASSSRALSSSSSARPLSAHL